MPQGNTSDHLAPLPSITSRAVWLWLTLPLVAGLVLYPLSLANYQLYHISVELFSVAVSVTLFSIGWNTRQFSQNSSLQSLAIAFLVIAVLDLLHTMTYKGMNIIPGLGVDPPTQFWIAARGVEASAYLLAAFLADRRRLLNAKVLLSLYLFAGGLLILSIWPLRIFPSCLSETDGLTTFKIAAEYVISGVLAVSAWIFYHRRQYFDRTLLLLMLLAIVLTILSEMAFTLYQDVYGVMNFIGHLLKLASILLIYRALVLGVLRQPYQTLFRNLSQSHASLDDELVQRRQVEDDLRMANKELDAFVHTFSHDMRSPLTVIMSAAEFLRQELGANLREEHVKLLEAIQARGLHMTKLLNDLLDLARIGHPEEKPERLDTAEVAAQVIEDLQSQLSHLECTVDMQEMPLLTAHRSLIYLLLINLVSNAMKYGAGSGDVIAVGGSSDEQGTRLFVRDHGPGIPATQREQIFDVFYRLGNHDRSTGTGIGLATVKKIANYYGGQCWVEETPGGGATFWVELSAERIHNIANREFQASSLRLYTGNYAEPTSA